MAIQVNIEKEKSQLMFPKRQTRTLKGRVISRAHNAEQNGWCCNKKNCKTRPEKGFHTSFIEAVCCGYGYGLKSLVETLNSVKGVTVDDYERAEPEQTLAIIRSAAAHTIGWFGLQEETLAPKYVHSEMKAARVLQDQLLHRTGRIWYFLQDAIEMFRTFEK